MTAEQPKSAEDMGRVVSFKPRAATSGADRGRDDAVNWAAQDRSPIEDIGRYERSGSDDDYRHRMTMNVLAFIVCLFLAGTGIWLADKIAEMRKNQDCVLSGRLGCTPVNVPPRERL